MRIRETTFEGFAAWEARVGRARIVIVHEVGPRIAWFGPIDGENLLFWDTAHRHSRGDWKMYGGHRLWSTRPGADEAEATYSADNDPSRVRIGRGMIRVTAPPDRDRIARTLEIRPAENGFRIVHHAHNAGDMLWAGGIWGLTCTRPRRNTAYAIPIGDGSAWDVVTLVIPRTWGGGHTSRVDDPQIVLGRDHVRVRPNGREAKRMIRAPQGVIAMSDRAIDCAFVKRARFSSQAHYPLATNIAIYVAPKSEFVEMETMSPIETVAPGERLEHVEEWSLHEPLGWVHQRG